MKKKWVIATIIMFAVLVFVSLLFFIKSNIDDKKEETFNGNSMNESLNISKTDSPVEEKSNQISSGVSSPVFENMVITYDGKPITLEYEFICENPCTMGLMIYVDGLVQPYKVDSGEDTIMHKVQLGANDCKRFKLSFLPISGKKGDTLSVVFANVYKPEIVEFNGTVNLFGNNQRISQSMPWKLKLNADSPANKLAVSKEYSCEEFTSKDRDRFIKTDKDGNKKNLLDGVGVIDIYQNQNLLDGKVSLNKNGDNSLCIKVCGNKTCKYKVSLYGDFKLLPINGCDYVEIDLVKDSYCVIPFSLDESTLSSIKNIYAVIAPVDIDNFLEKSPSVYVEVK